MSNPFGPPGQSGPGDQGPYGQQPPYGGPPQQPYGGPQQPYPGGPQQPYPGAPQQPYPAAPAGQGYFQPRRRKKWPWIVGGIVGVLVILVVVGFFLSKDDAVNAKVGDCITGEKDSKIVDCDDSKAAFRVLANLEDERNGEACYTPEIDKQGLAYAIEWRGGDERSVLCLTITKNTTVEHFKAFNPIDAPSQSELEAAREKLAAAGIAGVK